MKLENTLENKAKFFAQYYGCKVYMNSPNCRIPSKVFMGKSIEPKDFLELTPLSQISDEDAIEVAKIEDSAYTESNLVRGKVIAENFINYSDCNNSFRCSLKMIKFMDYLRSKGYALPWMGLSVEELIEYGWVKLK